jgi:hypothetical protein
LITSTIVYGFFFILTLYVLPRALREIWVSEAGLEVRPALGRRVSIPWQNIVSLELRKRLSRGARLIAKSGFSISLDGSLPDYDSLIAVIQARLQAARQGDK